MKTQTKEAPADIATTGKWRNLAYDKEGKTYRGKMLHASQESAIDAINNLEKEIKHFDNLAFPIFTLDGTLISVDYSHAIALPIDI